MGKSDYYKLEYKNSKKYDPDKYDPNKFEPKKYKQPETPEQRLFRLISKAYQQCMSELPPDKGEFGFLVDIPIACFCQFFVSFFSTPEWDGISNHQKEISIPTIMTRVFMEVKVDMDQFSKHKYKPYYTWNGAMGDNMHVKYTYWFE